METERKTTELERVFYALKNYNYKTVAYFNNKRTERVKILNNIKINEGSEVSVYNSNDGNEELRIETLSAKKYTPKPTEKNKNVLAFIQKNGAENITRLRLTYYNLIKDTYLKHDVFLLTGEQKIVIPFPPKVSQKEDSEKKIIVSTSTTKFPKKFKEEVLQIPSNVIVAYFLNISTMIVASWRKDFPAAPKCGKYVLNKQNKKMFWPTFIEACKRHNITPDHMVIKENTTPVLTPVVLDKTTEGIKRKSWSKEEEEDLLKIPMSLSYKEKSELIGNFAKKYNRKINTTFVKYYALQNKQKLLSLNEESPKSIEPSKLIAISAPGYITIYGKQVPLDSINPGDEFILKDGKVAKIQYI